MGLESQRLKMPAQLSGGKQQRVALARAMITRPDVILFDEPLSNLDAKLRESVRFEIKELQRQYQLTSIYVTHDRAEALAMSDKIVVLNAGNVEQIGKPEEIYYRPTNRFVLTLSAYQYRHRAGHALRAAGLLPGTLCPRRVLCAFRTAATHRALLYLLATGRCAVCQPASGRQQPLLPDARQNGLYGQPHRSPGPQRQRVIGPLTAN